MTPLRRRYIEDLQLKHFSPGTIKVYVHAVAKFARHFGKSPEQLDFRHVRQYLIHLIQDRRLSRGTYIVYLAALRHLYHVTLNRPGQLDALPIKNREHKLPVVLSKEEVRLILAVVTNLKHKALIMVAYDSGLRLSELRHLRIDDIDSNRMTIRVRLGKGQKDRYARLTPELLKLLREYWLEYRPQTWLFPGETPDKSYDMATPGRILKKLCRTAGIQKRVTTAAGARQPTNDSALYPYLRTRPPRCAQYDGDGNDAVAHSRRSNQQRRGVVMTGGLEVADVFRDGGARFEAQYGRILSREQRRVIRALLRCRTAALGGHLYRCQDCGHEKNQYNSCRNRHCPKCQAMARSAWLAVRQPE